MYVPFRKAASIFPLSKACLPMPALGQARPSKGQTQLPCPNTSVGSPPMTAAGARWAWGCMSSRNCWCCNTCNFLVSTEGIWSLVWPGCIYKSSTFLFMLEWSRGHSVSQTIAKKSVIAGQSLWLAANSDWKCVQIHTANLQRPIF